LQYTKTEFSQVYELFGGRMCDISRFLKQWQATEGLLSLDEYEDITRAMNFLEEALDGHYWATQHKLSSTTMDKGSIDSGDGTSLQM
jgi:hypothetical protein